MFHRSRRLTDKKLFALIFRQGVWQRGRFFSLRYVPARANDGKISFVISKKVAKAATARNQMKRRLQAAFQTLLADARYAPLAHKFHFLVIVHRPFGEVAFAEVFRESTQLLRDVSQKSTR